jgi:hypothetical protein
MNPFLVVAFVALGHIWWGFVHPMPALRKLNADPIIVASYHSCWYHISVVFLVTAACMLWHFYTAALSIQAMWILWVTIFGCWLSYWGVLLNVPTFWRIAWGQMALIALLLLSLGLGAYST